MGGVREKERGRGKAGEVREGRVRRRELGRREERKRRKTSCSREEKSGMGDVPFSTRASSYL